MHSRTNKLNNIIYGFRYNIIGILLLFLITGFLTGCAAFSRGVSDTQADAQVGQKTGDINAGSQAEVQPESQLNSNVAPSPRPSVSWQPSFAIEDVKVKEGKSGLPEMKVGARISSHEKTVSLREAMKALADLKGFTVSWNSDVTQDVLVDVDIKPDDDFWTAIENMLRQKDYWYEFKDDTLIIGYGKTVTYVIAMPNVTTEYTASVGGNMLGEGTTNKNLGELSLTTVETGTKYDWAEEKTSRYINRFDVWKSIRQNLDSILRITEERVSTSMGRLQEDVKGQAEGSGSASGPGQASIYGPGTGTGVASYGEKFAGTAGSKMEATGMSLEPATWQRHGEGEYTIDESLGIIKVTTSPKLQESVKEYIDTLKKWLFCQVYIQANILEVELLEESSRGIDWSQVFKAVERETALISGNVEYGDKGSVYEVNFTDAGTFTREGMRLLGKVTLNPTDFKVLVNALDEQGTVHTISEPRLNLLNGSPGVLTVGRSVSYISEITAMRSGESGEVDYTVETADVLEGLAFFVLCNVMENDEIILHLTPVTSQLVGGDAKDPIKYKDFGPNKELTVGLPQVNLRQMSTMAKVKDGDLLILGGLIDEVSSSRGSGIPILSKIPWVKWAFSNEIKSKNRRELIVLLRPHILPM